MADTRSGRVVVSYGREAVVETDDELARCNLRRSVGRPVCGDYVRWRPAGTHDGVIESIEPRRNVVARPDYRARLRPLAANVDLIVIVLASEPGFTRELVDRYLVLAESLDIAACLFVNKADLLDAEERRACEADLNDYPELGYPVHFGSSYTGEGLEALGRRLAEGTSVLVGQSGVGKSSLVQRLLPDQQIRVGALSEASGLGRHTTTETTLYHLPNGGDLIDSPGIRTLRLGHLDERQIAEGFKEFRPFAKDCRFADCRHQAEPDCAVAQAARDGHIGMARLESYRSILAHETRVF